MKWSRRDLNKACPKCGFETEARSNEDAHRCLRLYQEWCKGCDWKSEPEYYDCGLDEDECLDFATGGAWFYLGYNDPFDYYQERERERLFGDEEDEYHED